MMVALQNNSAKWYHFGLTLTKKKKGSKQDILVTGVALLVMSKEDIKHALYGNNFEDVCVSSCAQIFVTKLSQCTVWASQYGMFPLTEKTNLVYKIKNKLRTRFAAMTIEVPVSNSRYT